MKSNARCWYKKSWSNIKWIAVREKGGNVKKMWNTILIPVLSDKKINFKHIIYKRNKEKQETETNAYNCKGKLTDRKVIDCRIKGVDQT